MNLKPRTFLVDEDENIRGMPYEHFVRINQRRQKKQLFAGKYIRAIFAIVQREQEGAEELFREPSYLMWRFDEDGLLNEVYTTANLSHGAWILEKKSDWKELLLLEHSKQFRWEPTDDLVSRLHLVIRNKLKRG